MLKDAITTDTTGGLAVVPRPKHWSPAPGAFRLTAQTPFQVEGGAKALAVARLLASQLAQFTGLTLSPDEATMRSDVSASSASPASTPTLTLALLPIVENLPVGPDPTAPGMAGLARDEAYRIVITPGAVRLEARGERGLFYAGQTLLDLIRADKDGFTVPAGELRDWPDFAWRGLLVATGQRFYPVDELKLIIDRMARGKLNLLHLHLTDNLVFTPRLESYPELAGYIDKDRPGAREECYSKDDLRELVAYAAARQVDIMPSIEIPGHAMNILKTLAALHCEPTSGPVSTSTMCIGRDETYQFIERVADELAPLFPFPYFHIGTDEVEFTDQPQHGVFFSWRECKHCQARMKQEGLKDVRALFYDFVRRTVVILKRHGKRTMMWNDQIDTGHPGEVDVPRDVLMHYWRIAEAGRGPWENCTYERLLELGFPVVNSWYPETYVDIYIKEENLARWNPYSVPELPVKFRPQVLGSTMCAWAGLDLYKRALPSAIPFFGDRVWNVEPIPDTRAFARQVARHVFGPRAPGELIGIYEALGGLILPLQLEEDKLAHADRSLPGLSLAEKRAAYQKMIDAIDQAAAAGRLADAPAAAAYRESLVWLLAQPEPAPAAPPAAK